MVNIIFIVGLKMLLMEMSLFSQNLLALRLLLMHTNGLDRYL